MTLERIQIDLINLEQTPDALMRPNLPALKYIGHIIDQFAKYNVLYALRTTSADEVAEELLRPFWVALHYSIGSWEKIPKLYHKRSH